MLRDWDDFVKYYPDDEVRFPLIKKYLNQLTSLDCEYDESNLEDSEGPTENILVNQKTLFEYEREKPRKVYRVTEINSDEEIPDEAVVESIPFVEPTE